MSKGGANGRREIGHFDIDPERLDEEWLAQPRLFHNAAAALADAQDDLERAKAAKDLGIAEARLEADRAKVELELVTAMLDRDIRHRPEKYGIEGRVTEGAVEKTVLLQKKHQETRDLMIVANHKLEVAKADSKELIAAKHAVEVHDVDVKTYAHKKTALEKLVDLRLSDYWAEPRAGRKAKADMDKRERDHAFGKGRQTGNRT